MVANMQISDLDMPLEDFFMSRITEHSTRNHLG
jgi:hypothetical protein